MPIKRYKPEQIVTMLRQIEVSVANGKQHSANRESTSTHAVVKRVLKASLREGCQCFREYQSSSNDAFRRRVLVRPVAVSVAAGDEQHRDRSDACDEKRVMISTTDHRKKVQLVLTARVRKRFDYCGSTVCGRVGVQQLAVDR